MLLTDGKKTAEVRLVEWNGSGYGPDWSLDFYEAGGLKRNDAGAYIVEDLGYSVDCARDWEQGRGDFAELCPWDNLENRAVFVEYLS